MTSSFKIDPISGGGVLPQHIGIAIGPFQEVDLSEYRDTSEDDRLQDEAVKVHAFCLPGKEDELRNSAMIIPRTLDNFTDRYQTYRLGKSYQLAFVDDLDCDTAHTMALTICSSRLLFPYSVWEPIEHTTRVLVHAVASQWIGVDIIAQEPADHWIVVGGSWFMTEFYLKELFGRNDHRFRQKKMADQIIEMDVRRPSLYDLGKYLSLDPGERKFMELKSLSVLSILHNRLVKASGKNGVDRCLYKMLLNHASGALNNGAISTHPFQQLCEKVGHQKLENFFNQWVYGSGCPTFECHPTFNKKKQVVQLTIRQTQGDPSVLRQDDALSAADFMREAKENSRSFYPDNEWPAFVGPMTIRIHEADGTPYEHIVDINSSNVRVEIPYNTKYKRLKRNRLNKERMAAAQGQDASGDMQDEVTFYSLGDLFLEPDQAAEWKIEDWPAADEQKMENEAYEWIRVDADFEWISRISINDMPSYMFVSQLQQDKDVVAQAESIQYLSRKEGHGLISSFLIKTLMDNRYFHGIRTMAAEVLAKQFSIDPQTGEKKELVGLFHLKKAFQELFCLPNSPMTRQNDFSDRASYLIQCAIPRAIAKVKGYDGKTPMEVKHFLLDVMRYNDNRGNAFSDDHYLATLMRGLTECLLGSKPNNFSIDPTLNLIAEAEEHEFKKNAIGEIDRHKRLDEWIPTYHNIYTTTALECDVELIMNRLKPLKISEFLLYTRAGNAENVRLSAWKCLIRLGMFHRNESLTNYMIHELHTDPSPYFRTQLLGYIDVAIGQIAVGDVFTLDDPKESLNGGIMFEEETAGPSDRAAELRRRHLDGAIEGLKMDLEKDESLKASLEKALKSRTMAISDVTELLDFCHMFVKPVKELKVTLKYPRYWKVQRVTEPVKEGSLLMRFYPSERVRTKMIRAPIPKISLKLNSKVDNLRQEETSNPGQISSSALVQSPTSMLGQAQRQTSLVIPLEPPAPVAQKPASPLPSPKVPKPPTPPTPLAKAAPAPTKPPKGMPTPVDGIGSTSTPMEGLEYTSASSAPSTHAPAPVPTPKPTPAPAVAPPLVNVTPPLPSPAAVATPAVPTAAPSKVKTKTILKAPKPPKAPSQARPKKSKIVTLRLPPEKLARVGAETSSKKRKADGEVDHRPAKRQSMEPLGTNGVGHRKGRVTWEKTRGDRPRFMVKMKFTKGALRFLEERT